MIRMPAHKQPAALVDARAAAASAPKPTLILSPAQAGSVYSAICALSSVSSVSGDVRIPAARAQQDIRVQWGEVGVTVGQGLRIVIERYDDQFAFAAAYNLISSEPQSAVAAAAGGLTQTAIER